jgi:hypothetical protein
MGDEFRGKGIDVILGPVAVLQILFLNGLPC